MSGGPAKGIEKSAQSTNRTITYEWSTADSWDAACGAPFPLAASLCAPSSPPPHLPAFLSVSRPIPTLSPLAGFEVTIWQAAKWNQNTGSADTCEKGNEVHCNEAGTHPGSNKTVFRIAHGDPLTVVIPTEPSTDVMGEICVVSGSGAVSNCGLLGDMSQDSAAPDMIGRIGTALTVSDGIMPPSTRESRAVTQTSSTACSDGTCTVAEWSGMSFDVNVNAAGYGRFSLLEFTAPKSNTDNEEQLIDYQIVRTNDGKAYTLCCRENAPSNHNPTRCSGDLSTCASVGTTTVCTTSPEIKWVTVNGEDSDGQCANTQPGNCAATEPRCRAGNAIKVWIGCTGALVRNADYNPLGRAADWHEQDPPTIQHGATLPSSEGTSATACRADYHVQPQTAYTWKIIARNDRSASCMALEADGTTLSCNSGGDLSSEAFGWFSADPSHIQSTATPTQPTNLTLYDAATNSSSAQYNTANHRYVLDATMHLSWNDPADTGGLAITQTRVWCKDQTEVVAVRDYSPRYGRGKWPARIDWVQPDVKVHSSSNMAACDSSAAGFDHCVKVTGLKAGTRYWCTTSAANSAGGLDEAEYFAWSAVGNTLDSFPSFIQVGHQVQGLYEADTYHNRAQNSIVGKQGGAPASSEPRLGLDFRCRTPRPNAVSLNNVGPTHYRVKWDSADGSGRTMIFSGRGEYEGWQERHILQDANSESRDYFEYDTQYTIQVRAYNDIITDCNGPCGMHEAPGEEGYSELTTKRFEWRPPKPQNLAVKETLDRSVIITFDAPARTHGSPITHYVYQIWKTDTSDSNPATPTTDCNTLGVSSWCSRKYMCQNDQYTNTSGWSEPSNPNYMNKGAWGRPNNICSGGSSIATDSSQHTTVGFRLTDGSPYVTNEIEGTSTLQPETNYTVIVRAENAYGTGWPSDPVNFTTKTVPSTPTLVSETSRSITVEWNQYTDGGVAIAYKVYCEGYVQTGGTASSWTYPKKTIENRTTSLSHTFEDLTPGQAYHFWVKAVTPSGSDTGPSYTTSTAFSTLEDDPDTPLEVEVLSDRYSRSFRVQTRLPYHNKECNAASGSPACSSTRLDEIEVSISPPGTLSSTFTATGSSNQAEYNALYVTNVAPNVTYAIEVRVKSGARWSSKSTAIMHTTCDEEPERISTVWALNGEKTNTSITLRWEAPIDGGTAITRYQVRASCTA